MKAASVNDIKKELAHLEEKTLQDLCLRLVKYKKENKELLTYLLFEAHDETSYINAVKADLDEGFEALPSSSVYLIKKSLRKILRIANKQIKYSGQVQTELELRIHFCQNIKKWQVPLRSSQVLTNLFDQQIKKIETALAKLPEDLQYDYENEIGKLK